MTIGGEKCETANHPVYEAAETPDDDEERGRCPYTNL